MSELSRSEKLAAAQLKLTKFRASKGGRQPGAEHSHKTVDPQSTAAAYFTSPPNARLLENRSTLDSFDFGPMDSEAPQAVVSSNGVNNPPEAKPGSLADYFRAKQSSTLTFSSHDACLFLAGSEVEYTSTVNAMTTPSSDEAHRAQYTVSSIDSGKEFSSTPFHSATSLGHALPQSSSKQLGVVDPNADELGPASSNSTVNNDLNSNKAVYGEFVEPIGSVPTATTEKILQLSQQLNGILQTSEQLTTSFTSSIGGFSSPYQLGETEQYCASQPDVSPDTNGFNTGPHSPYPGALDQHISKRSNTPTSTHSATAGSSYVRELEDRNVELAALLEKRDRAHERALAKLSALQEQYAKATAQAATDRQNLEQSASRDLARSQEQIRAHAQTIGVLVAEKTELQTKVSHLERLANDRSHEIEVIDDRLQTYRKQSIDLERSLVTLKSDLEKASQESADLSSQLERYKSDVRRERISRENIEAELQEAYSRLNNREHEVKQLELNVTELRRQLELVQVYANQLAVTGDPEHMKSAMADGLEVAHFSSREEWLTERANLIQRIEELENTALQASKDSGRLESQYKAFVAQVEQQAGDLRSQLSDANASKQQLQLCLDEARRALRAKDDELIDCRSKLEIVHHQSTSPDSTRNVHMEDETQTSTGVATMDSTRLRELEELTALQQHDLQRLTEETVSLKSRLLDAESVIHEKDVLLADRDSVLATATSERTALSRAVEQNRTLKQQLTELQDAFVSMSNQNMQLTNDLQREQHALRESGTIQHDYRGQLERLQEHCARRESEYNALSEAFEALSRELDRAREHGECDHATHTTLHVEARQQQQQQSDSPATENNDELVGKLMKELENSHATLAALETRLELFETVLHRITVSFEWLQEQAVNQDNGDVSRTALAWKNGKDIRELHEDALELVTSWDRLAQSLLTQKNREVAVQAEQNRQHQATLQQLPSVEQWNNLQLAHNQLESKFVDCMDKLSRATEDRAKLESVVTQLEMEAATVGEYVTLFAHRRAAAARRAQAREHLLGRLVKDRMRLRSRLQHMKELVPQTAGEGSDAGESADAEAHKDDELRQTNFLSEFQSLLEEVNNTTDETDAEAGLSLLCDEDAEEQSSKNQAPRDQSPDRLIRSNQTLEQLRQQVLQHDCPHCQCCVGVLLEV
ncbi:Golgin sub A member 2 [Clonorchis sinensis]|uniref:Golgin sub A member 2 n=1 Tax=Clonorchis sinensis TaxID=79923 RepID=A0A419PKH2_CLOSI|nr:Golgin sub A member 2 [Clonorchis sinensis]